MGKIGTFWDSWASIVQFFHFSKLESLVMTYWCHNHHKHLLSSFSFSLPIYLPSSCILKRYVRYNIWVLYLQNIGFPMEEGHLEVLCIKNAFYQIFSCLKNHDRKGCISKYVLLIFAPNIIEKMQRKQVLNFLDRNLSFVTVCTSWHLLSKKRWMSTKKSESWAPKRSCWALAPLKWEREQTLQ